MEGTIHCNVNGCYFRLSVLNKNQNKNFINMKKKEKIKNWMNEWKKLSFFITYTYMYISKLGDLKITFMNADLMVEKLLFSLFNLYDWSHEMILISTSPLPFHRTCLSRGPVI